MKRKIKVSTTGVPACHLVGIDILVCHFAMLMLMLTAGAGWAYDPPRIIGEFYASDPEACGGLLGVAHYCFGDVNV